MSYITLDHVTCCHPDWALCGQDLLGEEWINPDDDNEEGVPCSLCELAMTYHKACPGRILCPGSLIVGSVLMMWDRCAEWYWRNGKKWRQARTT